MGPDYRELTPVEAPGPAALMNHGDAPSAGLELVLGDSAVTTQGVDSISGSGPPMMEEDATMVSIAPDTLEVGQETEEDAEGEEEWD